MKKILFLFFLLSSLYSDSYISLYPEISQKSFNIPIRLSLSSNESFTLINQYRLYHLDYPTERLMHSNNNRDKVTAITEISTLKYSSEFLEISIGRDYISNGSPTKISGCFISKQSSAFDFIGYESKFDNFKIFYNIIKLDNKLYNQNNADQQYNYYVDRWFYYRRIEKQIGERWTLGFQDAIISTGIDRGLEWYYLTPLGIFQAEQLHQIDREDQKNISGNNDNGMLGFDLKYQIGSQKYIYSEFLIDDFQIDNVDRKKVNDVFGFILGYFKQNQTYLINLEYSFSSPWLYVNRGLYANFEKNELFIGLRYPHYHSLDFMFNLKLDDYSSVTSFIRFAQKGNQSLLEEWDALETNDKIKYFHFPNNINPEVKLEYSSSKRLLNKIGICYNILESSNLIHFYMGFGKKFKI